MVEHLWGTEHPVQDVWDSAAGILHLCPRDFFWREEEQEGSDGDDAFAFAPADERVFVKRFQYSARRSRWTMRFPNGLEY